MELTIGKKEAEDALLAWINAKFPTANFKTATIESSYSNISKITFNQEEPEK